MLRIRQSAKVGILLSTIVGSLWSGKAAAQAPAVPPAPGRDAYGDNLVTLDQLEWIEYFEPFTDNPLARLKDPPPTPTMPPLFEPFDPMIGLIPEAQFSWLSLPGGRDVVYAPSVEVPVGGTVDVPFIELEPFPTLVMRVILHVDRSIVEPIAVLDYGVPTSDTLLNVEPADWATGGCKDCIIAFNIPFRAWPGPGPMLGLRFKALKPGDVYLRARLVEVADGDSEERSIAYRPGMIRVLPKND